MQLDSGIEAIEENSLAGHYAEAGSLLPTTFYDTVAVGASPPAVRDWGSIRRYGPRQQPEEELTPEKIEGLAKKRATNSMEHNETYKWYMVGQVPPHIEGPEQAEWLHRPSQELSVQNRSLHWMTKQIHERNGTIPPGLALWHQPLRRH